MSHDILLGVVTAAQGLRGEVKVKTFTENPAKLGAYGVLRDKQGREFTVASVRAIKPDVAILRFTGIDDRNAAEALKGTELYVARTDLPQTGDDEFYHADLIGLSVQDAEGHVLGRVSALHDFGAGDVIAIAQADGSEIFLSFTREIVPTVDVAGGRIVVVVPPADDGDKRADP